MAKVPWERLMRSDKGFSLIEILVAVTIMGLAYVAILQSFSLSARNITKMEESRSSIMRTSMEFEKKTLSLDKIDSDVAGEGEVVVTGQRFQLTMITDDNDTFMTLKLDKK